MDVHLSPELERFVQQKIQSGNYSSADEVVQEALRQMSEREDLLAHKKEIQQKIKDGYDSIQSGRTVDGEEFFNQLEQRELAYIETSKQKRG